MSKHVDRRGMTGLSLTIIMLLLLAGPLWAAVQSLEIYIEDLNKGRGTIRGSEVCSLDEFTRLKALLDAGMPALADCFLEADRVGSILKAYGLTVRQVNTYIAEDRHELTWEADFSQVPRNFGPLHDITLESGTATREQFTFYARLGQAAPGRALPVDPTLANLSVVVRLQVEGTVLSDRPTSDTLSVRPALNPGSVAPRSLAGVIDHSGEVIRWTIDGGSLQSQVYELTASIASGSARKARYWLFLSSGLTLLVLAVAFAVLYRGFKKPQTPIA